MLKGGFWLLTVGFWLLVSCGDDEPTANSQEPIVYSSPIDYEIVLAGNFGEPRPYHFHGGIDVKTGNVEGKNIFAIADGYVSRLTVNMYGFGNAIYVSHPDGNTSVYCHLKRRSQDSPDGVNRAVAFSGILQAGDHLSELFYQRQFLLLLLCIHPCTSGYPYSKIVKPSIPFPRAL